jgi:hypothetical protein
MATDWRASTVTSIVTAALGIVWFIPVVFMALRKRYSDFRLVLTLPGDTAPLAITGRRVIEVWWRLIWRFTSGVIVFGSVGAWLVLAAVIVRGFSVRTLAPWIIIGANLAIFIWSFVVMRMMIETTYSDFPMAIVPRSPI